MSAEHPSHAHHSGHAHRAPLEASGHSAAPAGGPHDSHRVTGADAGHDKHAGHSRRDVPPEVLGHVAALHPDRHLVADDPALVRLHRSRWRSSASRWIPAIFGTLVFVYGGWVFIRGAVGELRDRLPGMMTLISLAISVAFVFSLAVTLGFPGMDLWWELATLVTIMVLGHWIEMRSISQAQGALARAGEAAARHCAAHRRRPRRRRSPSAICAKATWCWCGRARASRPTASCRTARAT